MTDRFDRNDRDPLADMLGFGFLIAGLAVLLHAYLPAIDNVLKYLQARCGSGREWHEGHVRRHTNAGLSVQYGTGADRRVRHASPDP